MKPSVDHVKIIRGVLGTILHTPGWNMPCVAGCLRCVALASLAALQEERERLRAALKREYAVAVHATACMDRSCQICNRHLARYEAEADAAAGEPA